MPPVEIIALVFIVFALVKVLVVGIDPASWRAVVKAIYAKPLYVTVSALLIAALILKFLLQEMTIVQVFAAMTFMMALMVVQFAALGDEVVQIADKFLQDKSLLKKIWLPLTVWIGLMVWVLYEIFI